MSVSCLLSYLCYPIKYGTMSSPKPVPASSSSTTNGNLVAKINKLMDMVTELKNAQNKIITSVNSCRDSIKSHETKFDTLFNNLSQQLTEVINENNSLKDKVQQLETKLSGLETGQINNIPQEKLFSEFMDRQSRARNIMLFNIPEFSSTVPADKCNDTSSFLADLFTTIGLTTRPVSMYRLGKHSNKSRPLRIVMPTPGEVFEILKVKRKLLNVAKFASVRISTDRTVMQQNYFKSVLSELKARRDSGENDIVIKYLNNIPTISKNYQSSVQH